MTNNAKRSAWFALAFAVAALTATTTIAQDAFELNAKGVESYNADLYSEAVALFEKAIALAPDDPTVKRNLSNAYQAYSNELALAKDMRGAIDVLTRAVAVDPENARPLIQLGVYSLQQDMVGDAIFRLEEAIELTPKDIDAHFFLGEAYYRDNDVTSAIDQWEWVYQVDPDREGLADKLERALREELVEYDFAGNASQHFNLTFDRNTTWKDVQFVLRTLETAYRDVGRQLNAYPPAPVQVTLYTTDGFLEATQMGDHVGGLFDGTKIRVPVLDKDGKPIEQEDLKRRLVHEYVHVAVRHVAKENVPWWFNEGLAESLSRNFDDADATVLRSVRDANSLFSLADLDAGQLSKLDASSLGMAYRQSHATVEFLKRRYGMRKIASILHDLGAGQTAEDVLRYSCRFTYKSLELAVAASLGKNS